ncbi:dual specificity mitogen-activated protein kinase kinase hemipterous MAPKK [Isosphaera pallida ATCC 43644]|uniref:Dual specificity mitogen-activated protein kinase kinase hemipterous MAPKK n=1 Tax=Isosphaera pallida (strain ATCC 43644 / DSM 9630 / IS1B) TaxID=575540 RepID=E8R5A7_ISOPI|nr:dual specificity mitogen-activated protein kinase kinase hemipterous MAPKK [Isosphaera pallida ATCC 43644]
MGGVDARSIQIRQHQSASLPLRSLRLRSRPLREIDAEGRMTARFRLGSTQLDFDTPAKSGSTPSVSLPSRRTIFVPFLL